MSAVVRTGRRWSAARAAALVALLVTVSAPTIVAGPATPAHAAVVDPFTVAYDKAVWGDYFLVGNSQLECVTPTTPDQFDLDGDSNTTEPVAPLIGWSFTTECATDAGRDTVDGSHPNDRRWMAFTQTDLTTSGIFNSSDVTLTIPSGATVDFARLYWHGNDVQATSTGLGGATISALDTADTVDGTPGAAPWPSCQAGSTALDWTSYGGAGGTAATNVITDRLRAASRAAAAGSRNQMKLRVGAGAYQTVTSTAEGISPTASSSGHLYQEQADVTGLLSGAPTGTPLTLTGANISTGEGFGCTGAWSLAMVFKYPARNATYAPDLRRVQLYDGFAEVSSTDTVSTDLAGFLASDGGTVEPRVGVVAYEGDQQITGDSFALEGTTLPEPRLSPGGTTTDFWASTVGEFTSSTATDFARSPAWNDAAGSDIKVVPFAVGDLGSSGDGITATFSTSGDRYTPGVLAFSALSALLTGHVYEDTNQNGTFDANEPGIPGVTVHLTGTCLCGSPISLTVTTDSDGVYLFDNLPTANGAGYTVTETQPTSYLDGSAHVGSAGGADGTVSGTNVITGIGHDLTQQSTGYDFGEILPSAAVTFSHGAYAGHDSGASCGSASSTVTLAPGAAVTYCFTVTNNGNTYLGSPSLGDTGLDIVTAAPTLESGSGSLIAPAASTVWYLEGVVPGTSVTSAASVTANPVASDGSDLTGRSDVSGSATAHVNLPGHVDIGDRVWVDTNADGIQTGGEPGLAGVTVTLYDAADSVAVTNDAFGGAITPITTGGSGAYQFANLVPGQYTLRFSSPVGYAPTVSNVGGSTETNDSDGVVAQTPNLTAGTTYADLDSGFVRRGSVSGMVFDDLDASGTKGVAETGISAVTVTLTGTDLYGSPLTTAQSTASDGTYSFTNVLPGTYTVTETQPSGWGDGADTVGSSGGSNAVNDHLSAIVLGSNTAATGYLFAEVPSTIGGLVFEDLDGNGVLNGGDHGIPGVTVTLVGGCNCTTTTASDGTFYFHDLHAGTYSVVESQPSGWSDGPEAAGSGGGSVTVNDTISGIVLGDGQVVSGYTFAEYHGASVAGKVFDDLNANGTPDPGEQGIPGVTVTLSGASSASATSGDDGTFSFTGLQPGTYAVTESQPAGFVDGIDRAGSGGGSASVNDTVTGIVVGSASHFEGYTFAEHGASIAGVVYRDSDTNGHLDGGEPGIPGVVVTLTGPGNSLATATTDANGLYRFGALPAGAYQLDEAQPEGLADWIDTAGTAGGTAAEPDHIGGVALTAAGSATGYLFGEVPAASISGSVLLIGGGGVEHAAIVLVGTDRRGQHVSASVTSAADGSYSFGSVAPGTYDLTEVTPADLVDGPDIIGSAGGAQNENDHIEAIPIEVGQAATGYVFSEQLPVDLAVSVAQSSDHPSVGGPLVYAITVSNTGTTTAFGPIIVNQKLSAGVTPVSASGDGWECMNSGLTISCRRLAALAAGETAPVITVSTTVVDASADLGSQVTVSSPAAETTMTNNEADLVATPTVHHGLAITGADVARLLMVATGVLGIGLFLNRVPRRRRKRR